MAQEFNNQYPQHIGIILDGNRRYAKECGLPSYEGHRLGAKKAENILEWQTELDIKQLTLYVLSLENFNREHQEFSYLMDVFRSYFDRLKHSQKISENKVHINFLGQLEKLPQDIQEKMSSLAKSTKEYSRYIVNFAIGYGGRQEIIDSIKKVAYKIKSGELDIENITESVFAQHLYLQSEPDLIIRTGGDYRTSNFLTWQSTYSEWFFTKKKWPEFEKEDMAGIIKEYMLRERRFGR